MGNKIGVHVSAGNRRGFGDSMKACADAGRPWPAVFSVDQDVWLDVQQFSPKTLVVFRHQPRIYGGKLYDGGLDAPPDTYRADPVVVARNWMKVCIPVWRRNRANYYAPINEQDAGTLAGYTWLNAFTLECLRIARVEGFKLALYGFSAGNPRDDPAPLQLIKGVLARISGSASTITPGSAEEKLNELIPSLRAAKAGGDILLLHEYGFGSPADHGGPATSLRASAPHLALRYRRVYDFLRSRQADPDLLVSELSGGVGAFGGMHPQSWIADLQWWNDEANQDDFVIGGCAYQAGGSENLSPYFREFTISIVNHREPSPRIAWRNVCGFRINIRREPSVKAAVVGQVPVGGDIKTLDQYVISGDFTWWKVDDGLWVCSQTGDTTLLERANG